MAILGGQQPIFPYIYHSRCLLKAIGDLLLIRKASVRPGDVPEGTALYEELFPMDLGRLVLGDQFASSISSKDYVEAKDYMCMCKGKSDEMPC